MVFKSPTRPLCRICGTPIAKKTEIVYVRPEEPTIKADRYVVGKLRTKADCQAMVNEQVTAVRKHGYGPEPDLIYSFHVWDGESYWDQYFCNGEHAKQMGYAAAAKGWGTFTWEQESKKRAGR